MNLYCTKIDCQCSLISSVGHCLLIHTDSSLTHLNVSTVLNSVSVEMMGYCLRIPLSLRDKIADQSESEEERRNRLVDWWLKTSPYASWQWLSGWSHYWEQESVVSAAKRYVQRAPGEHGSCVTTS